jgi:hypothetical protein
MTNPDFHIPEDPLTNLIEIGIKHGIRVTIDNHAYAATIQLIYSGMDTMAFLGMPSNQEDVTRKDFVAWVDRYIDFETDVQPNGMDFYGARCSMLHTHGVVSRLNRQGECRKIVYVATDPRRVMYNPVIDPDVFLLSIESLRMAFFSGLDRFLVDLFSDPIRIEQPQPNPACNGLQTRFVETEVINLA